jgi:hypothetical protein
MNGAKAPTYRPVSARPLRDYVDDPAQLLDELRAIARHENRPQGHADEAWRSAMRTLGLPDTLPG